MLPLAVALMDSSDSFAFLSGAALGFGAVLVAMAAVWLLAVGVGRGAVAAEQRRQRKVEAVAALLPPPPVVEAVAAEAVSAEVLLVVAAAAFAELVEGETIVAIHSVDRGHDPMHPQVWSSEGRRQIFASHKVR